MGRDPNRVSSSYTQQNSCLLTPAIQTSSSSSSSSAGVRKSSMGEKFGNTQSHIHYIHTLTHGHDTHVTKHREDEQEKGQEEKKLPWH